MGGIETKVANEKVDKAKDIADAVDSKKAISPDNTKALDKDMSALALNTANLIKTKINFWDETKAGEKDKNKGVDFASNVGNIDQKDAIKTIMTLGLVDPNDIRNKSPEEATKTLQDAMYTKIANDPALWAKMEAFLQVKGYPDAGFQMINGKKMPASDSKFGARSLFGLGLLVKTTIPEEKPTPVVEKKPETKEKYEKELVFGNDTLGFNFAMGDVHFFVKDYPTFNAIKQIIDTGGSSVNAAQDHGEHNYNMPFNVFMGIVNDPSPGSEFAMRNSGFKSESDRMQPANKDEVVRNLTQSRQKLLAMLGAPYKLASRDVIGKNGALKYIRDDNNTLVTDRKKDNKNFIDPNIQVGVGSVYASTTAATETPLKS